MGYGKNSIGEIAHYSTCRKLVTPVKAQIDDGPRKTSE
jgi:hypothetical protein